MTAMPAPRPLVRLAERAMPLRIPARCGALCASMFGLLFLVANATGDVSPSLGLPQAIDVSLPGERNLQTELGRQLFHDPLLSNDGTMSCAVCHVAGQAFTVNDIATATGRGGILLPRNAPSLLNVSLAKSLLREGRARSLEEQIWGPLLSPDELANSSAEQVVARLQGRPEYDRAFKNAFAGREITRELIGAALAAYERSLVAAGSPFDQWYLGNDQSAMSAEAKAGFEVFRSSGCNRCHSVERNDATFSDDSYRNTGVEWARINGQLGQTKVVPDLGRITVTAREEHRYAFRVPTLRNVALTFPYMHDGSFSTLRDVIDFYDGGSGNDPARDKILHRLNLSELQKTQLIAFLESLTSDYAAVLAKRASAPLVNR